MISARRLRMLLALMMLAALLLALSGCSGSSPTAAPVSKSEVTARSVTSTPLPAPSAYPSLSLPSAIVSPTATPEPSPTLSPFDATLRSVMAELEHSKATAVSLTKIESDIASAYRNNAQADAVFASGLATKEVNACAQQQRAGVFSGSLNATRLMGCALGIKGLAEVSARTADGHFSRAALELWGWTLGPSGPEQPAWVTTYLKLVWAAPLGVEQATISGVVSGPNGKPLAGVTVTAAVGNGEVHPSNSASDGTFQISGLWPNTYYLDVSSLLGYPSGAWSKTGFTTDISRASPIAIDSKPVSGIHIQLPAGIFIKGVVFDSAGKAWPGVRVTAESVPNGIGSEVLSGANGSFALRVVPGAWELGFITPTGTYYLLSTRGITEQMPATGQLIRVTSTPVTGVRITLTATQ